VDGIATEPDDFGDLVFLDEPMKRAIIVQLGKSNACPGYELVAEKKANVFYCLMKYLEFEPEFVAHFAVFEEDRKRPSLVDYRKLLTMNATPAESYIE
jgi:hypothetical protein